jgi:hypothetical protein
MKRRTFIVGAGCLPAVSWGFDFDFAAAQASCDVAVVDSGLAEAAGLMQHAAGRGLPLFDVSRGGDIAVLWYQMLADSSFSSAAQGSLIGVIRGSDFFVLQRLAGLPGVARADFFGSGAVGFVLGP